MTSSNGHRRPLLWGLLLTLLLSASCGTGSSLWDYDEDGTADGEDCQPHDPEIHPGAEDPLGDGIDQDCDGMDGDAEDTDGDGVGNAQDCAPDDPTIYPGAPDVEGDGIDQNCDGEDGEVDAKPEDVDQDGYTNLLDCDDTDASIHPGADDPEGDGIDQNCDGIDGVVDTGPTGEGVPLNSEPSWVAIDSQPGSALDWGDVDRDGDVDLIVGHSGSGTRVHLNLFGTIEYQSYWASEASTGTADLSLGDVNNDGFLDLAEVGGQELRLHFGGIDGFDTSPNLSVSTCDATALAWGDANGDGALDLAIACSDEADRIHYAEGGTLAGTAGWTADQALDSRDLAFADWDGDGDFDLAVAVGGTGKSARDRLYVNGGSGLETTASWEPLSATESTAIGWGDVDGDGDPDLMIGFSTTGATKEDGGCALHLSIVGLVEQSPSWQWTGPHDVSAVALGDVDHDGDLDLATGRWNQRDFVFLNEGTSLSSSASWQSATPTPTSALAWGDATSDGSLDLGVVHGSPDQGEVTPPWVFANTDKEAEATGENDCSDGLDNDGDALIDCRDHSDCLLDEACPSP